ncbi:hypothetical protein I9W82_002300 [Candida metapsilosis]|uniref:Uncharacterized protein n=1 Tax=Candida metapsilosis TaxID=273372 RepID=A0A8H7ZHX5_9ASCO|nr:hypothetical protein I9W82_002300 [Candida metapsilosis]
MEYSPSSPEITPHKQPVDTLALLFDQVWDSTISETSSLPTQDLVKLAQNLIKVHTGNNEPNEGGSFLFNPQTNVNMEQCKGKEMLSKAETWDILSQLLQSKSDSEMDIKAYSSHEEVAMRSPESLPDVNDDVLNDELDIDADSDDSMMELQCMSQSPVPIPAPLSQPPVLAASPYDDDDVGLCYIDHCLNGALKKDLDRKTQQTLRQVIEEVAHIHKQVEKSFSQVTEKLDKLKSSNSHASQKLDMLHHGSDFMHSRIKNMQTKVKTIKENNTKVKRVVSFSDCCEVIPVSDKLPPIKTLSGSSLRATLHRQRASSYLDSGAVSPLQHKRRGIPLFNAPALKANTSVVTPTSFELDSDDDASEVIINDDMEPYRISREGSWQHLPTHYAQPHSPGSPYYKKTQDFQEEEAAPCERPDEPVKIQYILFILLLYFFNKLYNYCRSKLG